MGSRAQKALLRRAAKAGIHVEAQSCSRCSGEGSLLLSDPLDLARLREKSGISIYAFARAVEKPDGSVGVTPGFIKMVETADEKRGRRCPEWLLVQYLAIPAKDWKKSRGGDPWKKLRKMTAKEQRQVLAARREDKKRRAETALPIRRGQIYEKRGSKPLYRVEVRNAVRDGGEETVLIKRTDRENLRPKSISGKALRRYYRLVAEAA